ncbi:MAG: DUF6314 family protein [Planktomarina sp.]|nr:DUF6314 family protein [Planktomarina sp.]MDT2058599.1 DUF6314 family protein [Planktomarina sp.]MDT2073475.1 DUF6314 family protein [Planktomarina sp.]HAJ83786.1 trigger factor [Paracoccaceae bacterium]
MNSQDNHQSFIPLKFEDFTECFWNISRQIIDHSQGSQLTFTGRCEVSDGWYRESGQLVLADGQVISSTRRYLWKACTGGVDVHFDDEQFFHRIDLASAASQARHFCDPDDYTVSYDFLQWPVWTSLWRVKGPRKQYKMLSIYRKVEL